MIKSFLLIAIRNLWKNKTISIIKIAGLAIGLSAVLLIYLYVSFESSYDNYHKNGDRIYRVAYHVNMPEFGKWESAKTGDNLSSMLQNSFPGIESTTRVTWGGEVNILHKNQHYKEPKFMFADPSVLTMFSFPMKQGDSTTALNERNSVIISSRIAKKYFGEENPIGKYLDDNLQLKITGVMNVPDNSHFRFELLASYATLYEVFPLYRKMENESIDRNVYTYLLLRENTNISDLENKLTQFADSYIKKGDYTSVRPFLEPLKKIHSGSQSEAYYGEFQLTAFTNLLIYLFEFLGFIIIGIACFNFINIAIAQIVGRTKEVGVRKVFGSKKVEIFFQFVCEYWLYSFIAILLSMIIVQAILPFVSSILNRQIQVNYYEYFVVASTTLFLVTILAGAYPSFIIANVNPVRALQSGFKGPKGIHLRSVFVVSQFTVSIILILTSVYISKQINHLTEMDMGLDTKNLLVVKMEHSKIKKDYELFKSELLRNPRIISVSASSNVPAVSGTGTVNIQIDEGEAISLPYISIDAGFTQNLGIKTIQGRCFTPDSGTDYKSTFLLNKVALKQLKIDNPVGKGIVLSHNSDGILVPFASGQIIGVIDDYVYRPAYDDSKGVVFNIDPDRFEAMFIRINPNKKKETVMMIENTWKKQFQDIPFTSNLLIDEIKNEVIILKLYSLQRFISAVAICSFLIALLGLLGLSIFAAKHRVKEIGTRRVNGATMWELLLLMNRKFLYLVLLSILISFPIVYFVIEELKKENAKSVGFSVVNYFIAFVVIVILAMIIVSWQSWKAATRNPVEALRYE